MGQTLISSPWLGGSCRHLSNYLTFSWQDIGLFLEPINKIYSKVLNKIKLLPQQQMPPHATLGGTCYSYIVPHNIILCATDQAGVSRLCMQIQQL